MPDIDIRSARPDDADAVIDLLGDLNEHERVPRPDASTRERLRVDGFSPRARFDVLVAEHKGIVTGFALFFETYCSFLARPVLYLDAMFVLPEWRGRHLGARLFRGLAHEAIARGCPRVEWAVYGFNDLAVTFYDRMGAVPVCEWDPDRPRDREWRIYRLEGEALHAAAERAMAPIAS